MDAVTDMTLLDELRDAESVKVMVPVAGVEEVEFELLLCGCPLIDVPAP